MLIEVGGVRGVAHGVGLGRSLIEDAFLGHRVDW